MFFYLFGLLCIIIIILAIFNKLPMINIVSEEDYKNKVNLFKEKLNSYKKNRQEKIDLVTKKRMNATANLLKEINPILSDYSKKNGISIILRKQDIVLARTDLDITKQIIEAIDLKIKKINLN